MFESEFAAWLGADEAVGVASGTDAIELMLRALDIGDGASVVIPSFAPSAVAAAVHRAQAQVLYADVEPDTFTMSATSLRSVLQSKNGQKAEAALVVHLFGQPADWEALQSVADEYGIILLEDGAQAHGAEYHGRKVGTLGRAAAFSFYPTKNLGALGDAGAVVTSDATLAERLRELRQYGWRERFISSTTGVNSRLDEIQAAVLRVKLLTLDEALRMRREHAAIYDQRLGDIAAVAREGCEHGRHLYVIRHPERTQALAKLREKGIPTAIHYPVALHQQPAFAATTALPATHDATEQVLTLPLHPYLSTEAIHFVCDAIR